MPFWIFCKSALKWKYRVFWNGDARACTLCAYATRKRTYRILAWQNKIVIYRYCVILSNAFAMFARVSNRRGVHTRAFAPYARYNGAYYRNYSAVIRAIVYGFNNGLMGNRLHCRIRQIKSITNTTSSAFRIYDANSVARECSVRIIDGHRIRMYEYMFRLHIYAYVHCTYSRINSLR